jgi:predicted phosphodiesterase
MKEASMDQGPRTFRDQFLSIYQSMAADVARQTAKNSEDQAGALESVTEKSDEVTAAEVAAARFAAARRRGAGLEAVELDETATLEEMSVSENAKACASLALRLMWAKATGDTVTAAKIENEEFPGSKCDPKWANTVKEYLKYFGLNGQAQVIPYIKPSTVGPKVITINASARIGLIGDWGTGAVPAKRILRQLKSQNPDVLIHLGDIYYSGTEEECRINFVSIVDVTLDRKNTNIPVYTLTGNHDMYSGGAGYYGLIKKLNKAPMTQPASFFCLRSADNAWQLLAMDTGQFDFNPITVTHALTHVDAFELEWHAQRVDEFPGKTILLSHHQLFSAYSQIGVAQPNGRFLAYNGELKKVLDRLQHGGKKIAAWYWGHEHTLSIYKPYLDLRRGRCLGHSAIPVFAQDEPYKIIDEIDNPPAIVDGTKLSLKDGVYAHGFAMLTLGQQTATADYFEDRGGAATKIHSETID